MKSVLLYSLLTSAIKAEVISSDRFIIKILDHTISLQDIKFQLRNLKALHCIFDDSLVIQFFKKDFILKLDHFIQKMPKENNEVRKYLQENALILKDIRYFFKMILYAEDQKAEVTENLKNLIRKSAQENGCNLRVLYKDTLKSNFIALMEMELYFRSRYASQKTSNASFESIRSSLEMFIDSLDKQFTHEYYW